MSSFSVFASRGPLTESRHEVAVAVVHHDGKLLASAGNPDLVTFWRSAAKPFQVLPLIEDGGAAYFDIDQKMLALACGSHNAEPAHLDVAKAWLDRLGLRESDLHCGGHASLWPRLAEEMIREGTAPSPIYSNCSGKHAALLGLAELHGWPTTGYQEHGHPVQERVADTFSDWSGVPRADLVWGVDGCTAAAVALPLQAMALAYARFGTSEAPAAVLLRNAMMSEPFYVAGSDRIDTALMLSLPGRIVVKAGADGVFSVALPELGAGIALKVLDGDMRAAAIALVRVVESVGKRLAPEKAWALTGVDAWRNPEIRNTHDEVTGAFGVDGELRFS